MRCASRPRTDAEVKAHYRKLVRDNHPDRLMANGVPAGDLDLANRKLAAINGGLRDDRQGTRALIGDRPDRGLVGEIRPSPNFGPRRGGLPPSDADPALHRRGQGGEGIDWNSSRPESKVSRALRRRRGAAITQMVAEEMRAWHAGALPCGMARRISTRPRSASRSTTPDTTGAIRIFQSRSWPLVEEL